MLVSHHYGKEVLLEDGVSLLSLALHTVEHVVPGTGHHCVHLIILRLLLPPGSHVGNQMGGVQLLRDGDVREPSLQPAALLLVEVGYSNSFKRLTVTYFVKLALLEGVDAD